MTIALSYSGITNCNSGVENKYRIVVKQNTILKLIS